MTSLCMTSVASRMIALTFVTVLYGCSDAVRRSTADGAPLRPMAFFTGRTHGDGRLSKLLSGSVNVAVDSIGRRQGKMLILDQTIYKDRSPPSVRRWTMRAVAPNQYSGTLTEATGLVSVTVSGPRAYVHYKMKGGLVVEQELALQSDGKTILNRLQVHKLGVRVATLNETIHKLD